MHLAGKPHGPSLSLAPVSSLPVFWFVCWVFLVAPLLFVKVDSDFTSPLVAVEPY